MVLLSPMTVMGSKDGEDVLVSSSSIVFLSDRTFSLHMRPTSAVSICPYRNVYVCMYIRV